jgi:preprotein translocase subunit SecY
MFSRPILGRAAPFVRPLQPASAPCGSERVFSWTQDKGLIHQDPSKPGVARRLLYTVLLLLAFRLLAQIPAVNVDEEKLQELLARNPLLGALDLFAGGEVLTNFSIVAAGIFPYLFVATLVGAATHFIPALRRLREEKDEAHFKRYTVAATVVLSLAVAWGLTRYLSRQTGLFPADIQWFTRAGFFPTLWVVGLVTYRRVV